MIIHKNNKNQTENSLRSKILVNLRKKETGKWLGKNHIKSGI